MSSQLMMQVVWIIGAVVFGGVLHMVVVKHDYLKQLKVPVSRKLFGANKSIRGFVVMPLATALGSIVLYLILGGERSLGVTVFNSAYYGLLFGLGYVLFELPNSFIKRRLGIAPGGYTVGTRWFFGVLDQLDSAIGISVVACLSLEPNFALFMTLLLTFPLVALLTKFFLFKFNLKSAYI